MELRHIDIACLSVSPVNMRGTRKASDLSNILPSIRARGVLVPLIVRANGSPDHYEIVAGKRRYHAAMAVAEEGGVAEALPCAIMEAGDDAAALEASLIENIARLDPDEVSRWETFTRLVREGRKPEDIAITFGLTDVQVRRTLALGNLMPRIRSLYRADKIDAVTLRHLTLASKAQQRDWLALVDDESAHAPVGHQLKAWLFGGASIPVKAALFDLDSYSGEIISDLFGEDRWFGSAADFWVAQRAAIDARAEAYREAGWQDVVILEEGAVFAGWEHERRAKRKGGRVYVAIGYRGDVTFHEGYITAKEARRLERGEAIDKPIRPEISAPIGIYIDLHRHAAVRDRLTFCPGVALRLMVAHVIAGSALWRVSVEPQRAHNDAIRESVEICPSETAFDAKRRSVLALLGFDPDTPTVTGGYAGEGGLPGLYRLLSALDDESLLDILVLVMAETLEAGTSLVELLGLELGVDMGDVWTADDALLDLIRDREVIGEILSDVAGDDVAKANASATVKVQCGIVRDCLTGTNGREKIEGWVPRWMTFPPSSYTGRGGVGSVERAQSLIELPPALMADVDHVPDEATLH
ncbi:ParB/RepB/Spo0J family partition protein [Sphingomonas crocodyli]|uniref:ParB/RepB/Spo0J family partition protein n=1 Tax=Sphingomonas crocodyli TaxID=1979270 RepID=A0A437M666_9SPHN|nr:ParB/RepB/Spo0J family partition protein [Sphingomonas crocodyli]RVT93137.1 ParB/RepB/Spo0J family partition protein [Sphingomonas crocodyli]